MWINPNDKTLKQYLPWVGQKCLFAHHGQTYFGHHTGGSFQTGQGVTKRFFPTWECVWMPVPVAPATLHELGSNAVMSGAENK